MEKDTKDASTERSARSVRVRFANMPKPFPGLRCSEELYLCGITVQVVGRTMTLTYDQAQKASSMLWSSWGT